MQKWLLNILDSSNIPLLYGSTGIGKSKLCINVFKTFNFHTFRLICPLEPDEFDNAIYGIKNNPNQGLIIDNIDTADSSTINKIIKYLKIKNKNTKIILICINPYDISLTSLRSICTLYDMPKPIKKQLIDRAKQKGATTDIINILSTLELNDFRLYKNILKYNSDIYDSQTYLGLKNPFKAINWLLGSKNSANLNEIVDSQSNYYSNAVFLNYPKKTSNIDILSSCADHLSNIDIFNHTEYANELLAKTHLLPIAYKSQNIKIDICNKRRFYDVNLDDRFFKDNNIVYTLTTIITHFNSKKSLNKKDTTYLQNLIQSYKLNDQKIYKCFKKSTFDIKKNFKLKSHLKKIM